MDIRTIFSGIGILVFSGVISEIVCTVFEEVFK
jgi:hypothetical protein